MDSFKELIVWQKSVVLAKELYRLTSFFPASELYGLTSQLRRAAVSIPSNIAEGFSRKSVKENFQFLSVAFGSTSEIETQLYLSRELGFIGSGELRKAELLLIEIRKILNVMLSRRRKGATN